MYTHGGNKWVIRNENFDPNTNFLNIFYLFNMIMYDIFDFIFKGENLKCIEIIIN